VKRTIAFVACFTLSAACASAQLHPSSGAPLPESPGAVPYPAGTGGSIRVALPATFGVRGLVPAHHGTEVYELPVWSVSCPIKGRTARRVRHVNGVTDFERRGTTQILQSTSGAHAYPLSCRLAAIPGRYVIEFYDPGQVPPPALIAKGPDYIVP
jgi:hypothetical protein